MSVGEALTLGDVHLDKLALMHRQLDCAETQFGECIEHRTNWLGKRSCVRCPGPLLCVISHRHPLSEGQFVRPCPMQMLNLKYFD
jgi:hypothetical protein